MGAQTGVGCCSPYRLTDQEINERIKETLAKTPHCSACTHWTFEDFGDDGIDVGHCTVRNGLTAWGFRCDDFTRRT